MEKRFRVKVNSAEKIEELLQEVYEQTCKHLTEIQNCINKLETSTNLAEEGVMIDDKTKFAKAMNDFYTNKAKAMALKLDIAKFLGEILKYNGDANAALNDTGFKKSTKLDLKALRGAVTNGAINTPGADGDDSPKTFRIH